MFKTKYLFLTLLFVAGFISFAIPSYGHSQDGQSSNANNNCFLNAHGDVACPTSPEPIDPKYPLSMPPFEKPEQPIGGGLVFCRQKADYARAAILSMSLLN